jgi:hypothetical protein
MSIWLDRRLARRQFQKRHAFLHGVTRDSKEIAPVGPCKAAVAFGDVGRNGKSGAAQVIAEKEKPPRLITRDCEDSVGERDCLLVDLQFFECESHPSSCAGRKLNVKSRLREMQLG